MAWADVKLDIRNRLGEPNPGFWTDKELQAWYNEGVSLQHRAVWEALLQLEDRAFAETLENEYARAFLAKSSSASFSAGTQDYSVPTGFWRMVRAVVVVNSVECPADYVPFADDWDVRNLPHKYPMPTRPKYTLTPDGKVRFYMNPGAATVPNGTNTYYIYFAKQPAAVDIETGGVQDTQIIEPFNAAPKAWTCYRAMVKQYDGGEPYMQEFMSLIKAIVPGPSKDASEKKTIIIREAAAMQQGQQ